MKKRIAWITPSAYMDTDFYIVPLLCDAFDIDWFILYRQRLPMKVNLTSGWMPTSSG
jgi:hypothetical protein